MKFPAKLSAILIIFLIFYGANCEANKTESLRHDLENALHDYSTSIESKDHELLKSSVSSYLYNWVRNAFISSKQNFPEEYFKIASIDLNGFNFIASIRKGETANLLYFGESGPGFNSKGDPYRSFKVVKFVKEDGRWKYNGISEFGDEDFVFSPSRTEEENLSYLEGTDAIPDGVVLVTPKLCTKPDYVALVTIEANEIDTVVNINGYDYEKKNGKHPLSHVLWGGLKEGANTFKVISNTIDNATDPTLKVTIRASIDNNQNQIEIYKYERILGENLFEQIIFVSEDMFKNITK